jgi:transcriptional regulator with XRE-family HTH domain
MAVKVSEALLKGRRGIAVNPEKVSVADWIRNEIGLQGWSISTVAVLSNISRERLSNILAGELSITEVELVRLEATLGIEIPRDRLTPVKYKL